MSFLRLRISRAVFDPDGGADEAEGFADLVFQEALVGEVSFTARLVKRTKVGGATEACVM